MTLVILAIVGLGALAAGVLIGRYYVPDDRALKRTARHSKSYMRTINHLLARDRDAAVEELKTVVAENINDVEPYFALASLFRSRGEWERAIRVHQAIEMRIKSDRKTTLAARYGLGLDFRAAGMPRRATRAMEDCLAEDNKHVGALRALCGLYEEQARYGEAASVWKRLEKLTDEQSPREHHLLVAAGKRAIAASDFDSAKRFLREADHLDNSSVHLATAWAELAAAKGNYAAASTRLRQALSLAPELAAHIVPGLLSAEREVAAGGRQPADDPVDAGARATADAIVSVIEDSGEDSHLRLALAEVRSHFDPEQALDDYRDVAVNDPDLLPARIAAARLALASGDPDSVQSELRALAAADGALSWATDGSWRCGRCGRRHEEFFWRCGPCRHWGTVRLDVGRASQDVPADEPRERRGAPREGTSPLLSGGYDIPEATVDRGPSDLDLDRAHQRPSLSGRAGVWLSGAWSAVRGKDSDRD